MASGPEDRRAWTSHSRAGTVLQVQIADGDQPAVATVSDLPFPQPA